MNERIEELAKQCVSMSFYVDTASENFDYQKFAELIVKECVICAEREWIRNGDTEHNRAVTKVIESIKQHFGVGMSTEDKKTLIKELLGVKNETN